MKPRHSWSAIAAGAVALAVFALAPGSAEADTFSFSGRGADAYFDTYDESDGSFTSAWVMVNDGTTVFHDPPGGAPQRSDGTLVDVMVFQFVAGDPEDPFDDVYRDIYAFGSAGDFASDRSLTWATLDATLEGYACEYPAGPMVPQPEQINGEPPPEPEPCADITLEVSLTWAGYGNLEREGGNSHYRSSGFVDNFHFNGTRRWADVTGSISDGETDYTFGNSGFGSIFKVREGEVFID